MRYFCYWCFPSTVPLPHWCLFFLEVFNDSSSKETSQQEHLTQTWYNVRVQLVPVSAFPGPWHAYFADEKKWMMEKSIRLEAGN